MKQAAQVKPTGFTLIELLIVIALLGALAIGLLATIDPFEQLKKGRDTSLRNTVSEVYNANLRYYATKAVFPWGASAVATSLDVGTMQGYIVDLINQGELKNRFMELAGSDNLSKVYITSSAPGGAKPESLAVCFKPESKGFQGDPATVYDATGATSIASCKSTPGGTSDCFFCVQ